EFDAYVVDARNTKVPNTVKSYAGANTYNNFDTDNSVMYNYTADSPEIAKDNVIRYAGRVQGGDFRWGFDNSKDDAEYAVNQALKDALVAYKGGTGMVYQGGAEPQSSSSSVISSSSSSSVTPPSSSSVVSSSSLTESSSSSSVGTDAFRVPVASRASMRLVRNGAYLEISVAGPFRVDILRMDGTKMFTSRSRKIDLSGLRPGAYLARLIQKGQIDVKTFLR
ncbi:MAG: hypothetical protein J6U31_01125, partial [Bacteroidales bacterium]|nr:hypothetical protein [Bacteroidales bacterium]